MVDFEGLPAWARRRLTRRFQSGASERIVRWMSLPTGRRAVSGGTTLSEPASADIVAFVPRPDASPVYERARIAAVG